MRNLVAYVLLTFACFALNSAHATKADDQQCDPALAEADPRDRAPVVRVPPQYPARCMARAKPREIVSLKFDVTPQGDTTNITITDSTNNCLNEESIRSIAAWKYSCTPDGLKGVETTTTYELEDHASARSFEGEAGCVIYDRGEHTAEKLKTNLGLGVKCQSSVAYPLQCARKAGQSEYVDIKFDVSKEGKVKNIDVVESTRGCFNDAARSSVAKRKYSPSDKGFKDIGAFFYYDKAETPPIPVCIPTAVNNGRRLMKAPEGKDPRPICTVPPTYPEQCMRRARKQETVSFLVNVTPAGFVDRITLKNASNDCFVAAAKAAASNYRYEESDEGAFDMVVTLTFKAPQ